MSGKNLRLLGLEKSPAWQPTMEEINCRTSGRTGEGRSGLYAGQNWRIWRGNWRITSLCCNG